MGDRSGISWTDATWNPIAGCTRVSAGCDNCYAARQAATRLKHTPQYRGLARITPSGRAAFNGRVRLLPDRLDQPLRWRRPRRIFVNSMSDLFHEALDDETIYGIWNIMATCREHTFQVLTKRPARLLRWFAWVERENREGEAVRRLQLAGDDWPLPNVWLGVSCEDQATADERVPLLLEAPAAVRWISAEPLLGPLHVFPWLACGERAGLEWVVVGGESGPRARPFNVTWARHLRDQGRAAEVPVFIKQVGSQPQSFCDHFGVSQVDIGGGWAHKLRDAKGADPSEWPPDLRVQEYPA